MKQLLLFTDMAHHAQHLPKGSHAFSVDDLMDHYMPYQETESLLEEFLNSKLAKFQPFEIEPIAETDADAKFRYSSAMQKSIRRGYVADAVKYALTYHTLDPSGFWTRLVIVAFEDIGVGGAIEVALTLIAAKSKVWRQKAGGDEKVIHYIVKALAESVKDRSPCDMTIALWNCPRKPRTMNTLRTASFAELSEISLSEKNPSSLRASAAWLLWGTDKLENKRLPLRQGSKKQFTDTIEKLKVPALVKYITLRGMTACRYPMNVAYPFLWEMAQKSPYYHVEKNILPPDRFYIGGLPEETYDMYVRDGKRSLAYFSKACSPVNQWLTEKCIMERGARTAVIGATVFIVEGAMLDKKLHFEGSNEIYEAGEFYDYQNVGLSLENGRELAKLVADNSSRLRLSRLLTV